MRVQYQAMDKGGRIVRGVIGSATLPDALVALRHQGLMPIEARPALDRQFRRSIWSYPIEFRPGLEWRAQMIRQLATLLSAGITLDRALQIIESQASGAAQKKLLNGVLAHVTAGGPLSGALSDKSLSFAAEEIGLIRAGEQTGSLTPAMAELAAALERRLAVMGKLASALIYPAFLLALAPLSLIIIATVLVPSIAPLFENSGADMPIVLQAMILVSSMVREKGLEAATVSVAVGLMVFLLQRSETNRLWLKNVLFALPVVRHVLRRTEASRICRTLGSLLKGGASLQAAMSAVGDVATTNSSIVGLAKARDDVIGGKKLAAALKAIPSLDATALQMIAIGEETNRLEVMLQYIAETEEKAVERYVDRLMTILTPLLTISMGILVGGIVMSVMRAILALNDMAAQ